MAYALPAISISSLLRLASPLPRLTISICGDCGLQARLSIVSLLLIIYQFADNIIGGLLSEKFAKRAVPDEEWKTDEDSVVDGRDRDFLRL